MEVKTVCDCNCKNREQFLSMIQFVVKQANRWTRKLKMHTTEHLHQIMQMTSSYVLLTWYRFCPNKCWNNNWKFLVVTFSWNLHWCCETKSFSSVTSDREQHHQQTCRPVQHVFELCVQNHSFWFMTQTEKHTSTHTFRFSLTDCYLW